MLEHQAVHLVLKALEQTESEMKNSDGQDLRLAAELNGAAKLAVGNSGPATAALLLSVSFLLYVSARLKMNGDLNHFPAMAALAQAIKSVQADNEFDDSCPF